MTKEKMKNKLFLNQDKIDDVPDRVLQEYSQFVNMEKILANDLIGDLKDGEYFISNELKEELVENKKLLTKREDDFLIAKMERAGKTLKFKLTFEKFEKGSMIAYFYILEDFEGDILETFIANYIDVDNYEFKQKAREAFNICLQEEDYSDKEDDFYDFIDKVLARNKLSKSDERIFVLETYCELYIVEMLNALEKGGKLSKKILEEYKEEVKKQGLLKVSVPHVYIKLKKIMDETIEKNGGVQEIVKENPAVKKPIERFISPVIEYDKTVATIENMVKKQEEREEKKTQENAPSKSASKDGSKPGGSKSGGKGKKGGGGSGCKKAAKKKDSKKGKDDDKKPLNYYMDPKKQEQGKTATTTKPKINGTESKLKKKTDTVLTPNTKNVRGPVETAKKKSEAKPENKPAAKKESTSKPVASTENKKKEPEKAVASPIRSTPIVEDREEAASEENTNVEELAPISGLSFGSKLRGDDSGATILDDEFNEKINEPSEELDEAPSSQDDFSGRIHNTEDPDINVIDNLKKRKTKDDLNIGGRFM